MVPVTRTVPRRERGIGLVVALLVLLVMSLLATVLMVSVNVDRKITSHGLRQTSALNAAEAGVGEALARIRSGDIALGGNPRAVAQVFNVAAGSVPVLGTDSTGFATAQPAGDWLPYSTTGNRSDALTVQYKTDANHTVIYRYDPTKSPRIGVYTSGNPIYVVTSTGRVGGDRRRIQTEVIQKPVIVNAKGAVVAQVGIDFSGNADVCGYDHVANTPAGTRNPQCGPYEKDHALYPGLPGAWSEGAISPGGSSSQAGNPGRLGGQTGFYSGPWDCFNMTQAEFYSWVGGPVDPPPDPPRGIFYVDDDAIHQNNSGDYAYHGGDGEGLLYVDGSLTINGNFTFRGLIYIEGDLKINGTVWILGGLVVKGTTTVKIANGDCVVLYSGDAISQNISKYGANFINLSWREVP